MPVQPIATIYSRHIQNNYQLAKHLNKQHPCYAVIKAQAYGHLPENLIKALPDADGFAVARYDEAAELRQLGAQQDIVVLSDALTEENIGLALRLKLTPCIQNLQELMLLQQHQESFETLWLVLDTDMHRQGIDSDSLETATSILCDLQQRKARLVVMTHLACSDEPAHPLNTKQLDNFKQALTTLEAKGLGIHSVSIANSGVLLNQLLPDLPYPHIARPGIMLYGINPSTESSDQGLKMAMQLSASILDIRTIETGETIGYGGDNPVVKQTRVATIGIGYGDGFPRYIEKGQLKLDGQMCNILGRVSMDLVCMDVTDLRHSKIGDTVEIWGPDTDIKPLAKAAKTLSYELFTRLTQRVRRVLIA